MESFIYDNKTKIIFGKGTEQNVGKEAKAYGNNILLHHYGAEFMKTSGLIDRVTRSLTDAGLTVYELTGVKPNPRLQDVREGIQYAKEKNVDCIIALGGGSVIDSAKSIAFGMCYNGDVWDFFENKADVKETIPVGVILTLPGAGSESSASAVITKEEGWYKRSIDGVDIIRPRFAILDPELTYTLPQYQTASGACDVMSHSLERYFSVTEDADLSDFLCEAVIKTIIRNLPIVLKNPTDFNARANIMWAGTVSHNDIVGAGRMPAWECHKIEHELSGIYDVAHGAGLTAITTSWMKYVYKEHLDMFNKFAMRIWNIEYDLANPERSALEGINRLEHFFKSVGLPVSLKELGISDNRYIEIAEKCTEGGPVGWFHPLNKKDVVNVLEIAEHNGE